jgi:hypothetical protein
MAVLISIQVQVVYISYITSKNQHHISLLASTVVPDIQNIL